MAYRLLALADRALVVELGDEISRPMLARVSALDAALRAELDRGGLEGVVEAVPSYRSIAIVYDPLRTTRAALERRIAPLLDAPLDAAPAPPGRTWTLPVLYGGAAGPDLAEVAAARGLSAPEAVALHAGATYDVYVLGFLPGFAYLGDVAPALRLPRRSTPRTRVAPGSVAIAGAQTAIYPCESPGGWHVIGRCPVPLFDPRRPRPALLAPSDRVRFEPVPETRFVELGAALAAGRIDPEELATP
ncbi:MAG TPA: 5-oxoprolinase subunit PxpB [Anaeromyxobacter sp.]